MKPLVTGLIVCSVAILFVLWNRRFIFGDAKKKTKTKVKSAKSTKLVNSAMSAKLPAAVSNEEDATTMLLSELLSLNRAAHVLANSGGLLDKLLKLERTEACEVLLRDYELSSVMVLIKHDEEEGDMEGEQEEGFKKIDEIKKPDSKKAKKVDEIKKPDSKDKAKDLKDLDSSNDLDSNHHHSTNDPLRIALFCKNLGRPPRIGRVVRIVESESEKANKYIIELVK